jgi:hypothetical protein
MTDKLANQGDVFALPKPQAKVDRVYFDEGKDRDRVSGLGLRIRQSGSRSFVLFYRFGGSLKKYTIGNASDWTLDDARKEARKLRSKYLDQQQDPAAEKAKRVADSRSVSSLMFGTVKRDYLKARLTDMKPRSHQECERHLEKQWKPFDRIALSDVTQAAVAAQIRAIAKRAGQSPLIGRAAPCQPCTPGRSGRGTRPRTRSSAPTRRRARSPASAPCPMPSWWRSGRRHPIMSTVGS